MKDYLNNFFKRAKHESWEYGESFNGFEIKNGFSGFIFFSEDHFIECQIDIDEVTIYDSFTDKNHEYMFDAFSEYVQNQIRKSEEQFKDEQDTNQSLMYA